ncbi:hypothetical protein E1263_35815 [Kribbella antibiotica]|uniref:DUF4245 domain-containing protein n=1 Tax=Kribbella antibiotica TaxID=190195 RepID=A0A4R4YRK0_9ACTN|nr:hypothetical protein [Kribbella antibiotica]TDD46809.1 hypothetical protein E1263_35815 [Kribbella antibiotica]
MLTPRHQALLMTLAGMTVGVAVFGIALAINGSGDDDKRATDVVTSQTTPSTTPRGDGLQADSLQFAAQTFGTNRAPVSADVPTTWRATHDGERPRFQDPSGVWQIRFDTRGSSKSPERQVSDRERSIKESQLSVLSRDNGTLIYTYVDGARGPRMGLSRWVPTAAGGDTAVEITVGGRPQDEAALRAVLERATHSLQVSEAGNRPS